MYIYMQNWLHPVDLRFVYICQPCQIQKYHRDKQFIIYMYSIKVDHNNIALCYIAS